MLTTEKLGCFENSKTKFIYIYTDVHSEREIKALFDFSILFEFNVTVFKVTALQIGGQNDSFVIE